MTSTQEPPESGEPILPQFVEVAERYVFQFELDEDARAIVSRMLELGTAEVLRLPVGEDRDSAIAAATERLDVAMASAADELHALGAEQVSADALTPVMQGLCPVPPFCMGLDDPGGGTTVTSDSDAGAVAEHETVVDVSREYELA